ncbi:glycosyltransferase family 4 protein [Opitutaceae bacterium]|nr:glycosyltransferase family 4 protein [Opitutaceae bacterium]
MTRRVIFVNRVYWPSTEATAQLLDDLAKGLAENEIDVEIVTASAGENIRQSSSGKSIRIIRTGKHHGLTIGLWTKLKAHLRFLRAARHHLRENLREDDLVVTMTDPPLLGTVLSRVIRQRQARHWHWSQDVYPEVAIAILPNPVIRTGLSLLKPWRNRVWKNADGIVAIGHDMTHLIRNEVGSGTQIRIFPNWPPATTNSIEANGIRQSLGCEDTDFVIMYSGNLGRAHILTPVLDLAARLQHLPRLKFLIVGDGAQKTDLQEKVKSRSLDNVTFHPPVPLRDLNSLLHSASVHLVTMRPECSGTVLPSKFYGIIEARKPVLFIGPTDGEIARSINQHDIGAVCSPTNVDSGMEFLESASKDTGNLNQILARVDSFARNQTGLKGAIAEWTKIIQQIEVPSTQLSSKPPA